MRGGLLKYLPVSLLNPLELLVDRIGLCELVKDNIRLHEAGQLTVAHTPQSRVSAMGQLEQLKKFAAWLNEPEQAANDHINVFLYPDTTAEVPEAAQQ